MLKNYSGRIIKYLLHKYKKICGFMQFYGLKNIVPLNK
jgi:hypothetical protein